MNTHFLTARIYSLGLLSEISQYTELMGEGYSLWRPRDQMGDFDFRHRRQDGQRPIRRSLQPQKLQHLVRLFHHLTASLRAVGLVHGHQLLALSIKGKVWPLCSLTGELSRSSVSCRSNPGACWSWSILSSSYGGPVRPRQLLTELVPFSPWTSHDALKQSTITCGKHRRQRTHGSEQRV